MNCPHCNVTLVMAERNGVEIDYCPQCRGVWLDRGELDKIIERAGQINTLANSHAERQSAVQGEPQNAHYPKHGDHHHDDKHGKHSKKKSWMGELFDF